MDGRGKLAPLIFRFRLSGFGIFSAGAAGNRCMAAGIFFAGVLALGLARPAGAYHELCFSPLELATLLAPSSGSEGGRKSKIRAIGKDIRSLNKDIEALSEKADEAEELLIESLDRSALGGGKPRDAAADIREYMESKRSEWDCDEISLSAAPASPVIFEYSLFFHILGQTILGQALIPKAEARTVPLSTGSAEENPKEAGAAELPPGSLPPPPSP